MIKQQTRQQSLLSPKVIRVIHSYSSMLMLLIMLFFTVTGLTLNNRDWLPDAEPSQISEIQLPEPLQQDKRWQQEPLAIAESVRQWLYQQHGLSGNQVSYEWDESEGLLLIDVKRPGGYTLAEVIPEEGSVLLEQQHYGLLSTLNDLHMGRYSGVIWSWFIDISAVVMLLFTLTGFWLILPQKKKRRKLLSACALGTAAMLAGYWTVLVP